MISTVTSSLICQSVISTFCAPASTKPRRSPITPSPALVLPHPVSQADRVTSHVSRRSSVLTSSAVSIPSLSRGGLSPLAQASKVLCAPVNARPLRFIGLLKNGTLLRLLPRAKKVRALDSVSEGLACAKKP